MVEISETTRSTRFVIRDCKKIASTASIYDYHDDGFDWVLVANVDTKKPYMRLGYGTQIMNAAYEYIQKKYHGKIGLYLIVNECNRTAIAFYKKLGYQLVKTLDKIHDSRNCDKYYVLAKGNANVEQLKNTTFHI